MPGYVINNANRVFKNNKSQIVGYKGTPIVYHEISYSIGTSEFKAKIIAESFEVASKMIEDRYGHLKEFYINACMTGGPHTMIALVSPHMMKEMVKSFSEQINPLEME